MIAAEAADWKSLIGTARGEAGRSRLLLRRSLLPLPGIRELHRYGLKDWGCNRHTAVIKKNRHFLREGIRPGVPVENKKQPPENASFTARSDEFCSLLLVGSDFIYPLNPAAFRSRPVRIRHAWLRITTRKRLSAISVRQIWSLFSPPCRTDMLKGNLQCCRKLITNEI